MGINQQPVVTISRGALLTATLLVLVVVVSVTGTFLVTNSYFIDHPQISTMTYSTTNTVSLTQTETTTSYSTLTQTTVSTSISTQNANYNPYYNNYPNYQCQYPYYNSQCYGSQYQVSQYGYVVSDTLLNANGCYIQLVNMPPGYTEEYVTVFGEATYTNSNSCPVASIIVTSVN